MVKQALTCVLAACLLSAPLAASEKEKKPKGWLTGAPDDETRIELLERYLRGFDQPMWEVGARFRSVYDALERNNFDLALYHWDKIKVTIEGGYLKRPARKANAERILLQKTWPDVRSAFESRDRAAAWTGYAMARAACMACHAAESVAFMNTQPLFELPVPN